MQLGNAPKTHFWRICPEGGEGKPGAAEAAGGGAAGQNLEQNKPENKKIAPVIKMAPTTFEELLSCNKNVSKTAVFVVKTAVFWSC